MRPFGAPYAPSDRSIPTTIGPYRVLRVLAQGSTSDILLAREEGPFAFARLVVLKVLLPQLRDDEVAARRFGDEASSYARLAHPAIVRAYRFVSDSGELALALEFIDGLPLNTLRAELHNRGERLTDDAALFIGHRVFGALAAAHAARDPLSGEFSPVIHADINPSNVVVPWDGYARVVDFGSAQLPGSPAPPVPELGTRLYLAPEQARGEPVTARTDLYAASLIVWELLTDRRAMTRGRESNREVLQAMAAPRLASLSSLRPDLPKSLRDALARGLDPDPERRTLRAEDVCAVLRTAADLDHGRRALVDAIGAVRLASFHLDPLHTTPSLPEYRPMDDDPAVTEARVVHRTDRPVVFEAGDAPIEPPRWGPSKARAAAAVGTVAAVTWCVGLVMLEAFSGPAGPSRGGAPARGPNRAGANGGAGPSSVSSPLSLGDGTGRSSSPGVIAGPPRPSGSRAPPMASRAAVPPPAPSSPTTPATVSSASNEEPSRTPPSTPTRPPDAPSPQAVQRAFVVVPPGRGGHRVWIDGLLVGQSPGRFAVACGDHTVQVGSQGRVQRARLDCGDETEFR